MAIVKISDLPLVDQPVEGTDLFVVVQDNVTKKAYASDIQTYVGFEEVQTATAGQTVFNLTTMTYAAGANNLMVFVDGVNQYEGSSYTETDNNTVTFTQGLHEGALVKFSTVQTQTSSVANAGAVTFLQAGTGAVPRSVQSKERDIVSVKDFGAVGDGVTDDTAAIQAAVNAAKEVHFPAGEYVVSSAINVPNGTWLLGVGGFQNTVASRISKITFTATSGYAFQFVTPANLTNFYGDFFVKGLMISAANISSINNGGCLLFGNPDTANFGTYGYIGRVNIDQCWLTGSASYNAIGVHFVKVFDSTITNSYLSGFSYGAKLYGSDICKISQNRFLANKTHIRATENSTFGGGLKIEHNDILTCVYGNVWLEGVFGVEVLDNYIEGVAPNVKAVAQTGTLTTSPYSTTVTGSGTTFVAQFLAAIGSDDPRRVLIKVGTEYRQVNSITNNTTLVVDSPFLTEAAGQAWSIVYGTGIVASGCAKLSSLNNRIDITATSAVVPRMYCFGGSGNVSDFSGANADNGQTVVIKSSPGASVSVTDRYKLDQQIPTATFNSAFDFVSNTADGAQARNLIDVSRTSFRTAPSMLFDYRNWFQTTGVTPKLISASADVNGTPSVALYNGPTSVDDVSSYLPAEYYGKRLRIQIRVKPIGSAANIEIFAGATLGAKTTSLGSFSASTPGVWTTYEFCTKNPATITSVFSAITITKDIQIMYFDYVIIEALDPNDFIFGTGSPESVYTAPVGAMYRRTDGGANTTLYVKESGTGNTGWAAK